MAGPTKRPNVSTKPIETFAARIEGDDVFVDVGHRVPGVLSLRQFAADQPPELGQTVDVIVRKVSPDEDLIELTVPTGRHHAGGNWEALEVGQIVDCMVKAVNKGGLEVTVGGLRGFMPKGQIDTRFVEELEPFVGQKLTAEVIEVNPRKRNLVVSRRAFLNRQRREAAEAFWNSIEEGQTLTGTVKTLKEYGAFVDLGGADGFLHIGEISWTRIKHPAEVLQEGQQVEVKVLKVDRENRKVSLGMKQLVRNPWQRVVENYLPGSIVRGRVTRIAAFGAFVELEPGVEGMVHISELDYRRVNRVADVVQPGQEVDVKVLEVIPDRRRISLSIKQTREAPQQEADNREEAGEEAAPRRERRQRPLKGGIGGSGGGGLFGNPQDFT